MQETFIKLYRKFIDWEWFGDAHMVKLFIYLLITAQAFDGVSNGIEVKRGELVTGRKKLARLLDMSEMQIRRYLDKLQKSGEITIKTTNKYSVITIVKYSDYQGATEKSNQQNNQQITNKQPTNNHYKRKIESNKEKNINNTNVLLALSSEENRAVAKIPLNINNTYHYVFPEDIEHYKELYPAVDIEQEIRSMVGWCEANPNNRKTKSGVKRFIANWLNKSQNRTRAYSTIGKKGDEIYYEPE